MYTTVTAAARIAAASGATSHGDASTCAPRAANVARHVASADESGRTCAIVVVPGVAHSCATTSRPTNPVAPKTNAVAT